MTKNWIVFGLTALGAVVVGLWIYRKVNAPPINAVSGGAGSQSSKGGFRNESSASVITIGPSTVTPVGKKPVWDTDFVNSLSDYL